MQKRHVVRLTDDERPDLAGRFCGRLTLRERNRVQVLLRSDRGDPGGVIADALGVCVATVVSIRKRFAAGGVEAASGERPRSGAPPTFDGEVEAAVVALACTPTPAGRVEWTAQFIAGRLVELHLVETISERTVRRVLKKTDSSRGRSSRGACPGGGSGEFVAAMAGVLELYAEADDPKRPRVNFDACSVELHADARAPVPPAPGRPARIGYEDVRNGTANPFVIIDPAAGRRTVTVTERRTKADFAAQMKLLCDELCPEADVIRVVLDNLNTHTAGALYEAFAPAEARR